MQLVHRLHSINGACQGVAAAVAGALFFASLIGSAARVCVHACRPTPSLVAAVSCTCCCVQASMKAVARIQRYEALPHRQVTLELALHHVAMRKYSRSWDLLVHVRTQVVEGTQQSS